MKKSLFLGIAFMVSTILSSCNRNENLPGIKSEKPKEKPSALVLKGIRSQTDSFRTECDTILTQKLEILGEMADMLLLPRNTRNDLKFSVRRERFDSLEQKFQMFQVKIDSLRAIESNILSANPDLY